MKNLLPIMILLAMGQSSLFAQDTLSFLARYQTGVFDEGAAEISAFDPGSDQVYFTNADANSLVVLDISDPLNPMPVDTISLDPYGGGVNSVDIANGIVAASVEADDGTMPGKVVFFNAADGAFISEVTAGVLPDMLTFNGEGTKVIVANEGEPVEDDNDMFVADPEGSVTIVDLSMGASMATATQVNFQAFNGKEEYLRNKGIRIFFEQPGGVVSSAAQDLEPEYVTVAPSDSIAYVVCQENNGFAVVNINQGTVIDILPMNEKNYNSGRPALTGYNLNELLNLPVLGTPVYTPNDGPVQLSGFSGLWFSETESDEDTYIFYAIPDRGPNDGAVNRNSATDPTGMINPASNLRPFKLPDYEARVAKFKLELGTNTITLDDQIFLRRESSPGDTVAISGFGNVPGFDETPVTYTDPTNYTNVDWILVNGPGDTTKFHELSPDPYGGDFEGILQDNEGDFWMCDEYRPAVYEFGANGVMKHRYVPAGTGTLLGDFPIGEGSYGEETLPKNYSKRRANRGFEAIAHDPVNDIIYAFIQSPMDNPDNDIRHSDIIRILGIDATNGEPVSEFVYLLEQNRESGWRRGRVDKIGDAVYAGPNKFFVMERDSGLPGDDNPLESKKLIFEIDLTGATNMLDSTIARVDTTFGSGTPVDLTLESLTADELINAYNIKPVHKTKVLNLPSIGYLPSDKPEGLALLPGGSLAVINDNDFGLAGAGVTDESNLAIIDFGNDYAIDPSNRDDRIVLRNVPVLSYFMPDAITSYEVGGETFILTANEGDARDYETYSEEDRVADLMLNPDYFGGSMAAVDSLQQDSVLGRLTITTAQGDLDGDNMHEIIYGYGARSFSIWDAYGNLVWDSGNAFEQITAQAYPDDFNSTNDENDSFDNRSDDKGPEPEAIELGVIGDKTYAFIGLERIGGIMMYDVTDPRAPVFVQYINTRDFSVEFDTDSEGDPDPTEAQVLAVGDLGVEDLRFVSTEDSPVDVPLLITANEVTGSVAIFSIGEVVVGTEEIALQDNGFKVYPNPTTDWLYTDQLADYALFNVLGQQQAIHRNTRQIRVAGLAPGTYVIRNLSTDQSKTFVVE